MQYRQTMSQGWIDPNFKPGLVSIIIPCYNQENFLPDCLESIVNQVYRPLEVILIDDGSSDGTKQIMQEFEHSNMDGIFVKCIYQNNYGASYSRNQGCRASRGEFIQFIDGDDLLEKKKIIEQVYLFNEIPEIDVIYGDSQYLVDIGNKPLQKGKIISIGSPPDIIASFLNGYVLSLFSYLTRRSAINDCGPWNESLNSLEDMEYFLRLALKGAKFYYKRSLTGFYRKHSFSSVAERSLFTNELIRQRILMLAEESLRSGGKLNERRIAAIVECHRRIARRLYLNDCKCSYRSMMEIKRLSPGFLPKKKRARIISKIIGFENYEKMAAIIHYIFYKRKKNWLKSIRE